MKKLYVISGMTGMTGNELARQILKNSSDQIIGFDNFFASGIETISDIKHNDRLQFYVYDLTKTEEMENIKKLVLKQQADEIIYINCAAVVHTEHFYHVEETFETNVLGMRSFLNQAIDVRAGKFINCSTSEVYSMQSKKQGGVKEEDFLVLATAEHSQRTSYATGKLMTEFFLKDEVLKGRIRGCSIRFANVYSKNERFPKHIIPHIMNSLNRNGKVVLLENAKKTIRTFLHNTDSCKAVLDLLDSENALDGSVYNVATQEEISIIDLVYKIAGELRIYEPKIVFEGIRKADPQQRLLCTEKITNAVGWKPCITLTQGLRECVQYLNEEKNGK